MACIYASLVAIQLLLFLEKVTSQDDKISLKHEQPFNCHIYARVKTADCYLAGTSADIKLHYASLVSSEVYSVVYPEHRNYTIGTLVKLDGYFQLKNTDRSGVYEDSMECPFKNVEDFEHCHYEEKGPCLPNADAFFMEFKPDPKDYFPGWSLNSIYLRIEYDMHMKTYQRIFEFMNVFRCDAWLEEPGIYQFGPRHGLIIKHAAMPRVGDWVRPWV